MAEARKEWRQGTLVRVAACGSSLSGVMILTGVVLLVTSVIGSWLAGTAAVALLSFGLMLLVACLAFERASYWQER